MGTGSQPSKDQSAVGGEGQHPAILCVKSSTGYKQWLFLLVLGNIKKNVLAYVSTWQCHHPVILNIFNTYAGSWEVALIPFPQYYVLYVTSMYGKVPQVFILFSSILLSTLALWRLVDHCSINGLEWNGCIKLGFHASQSHLYTGISHAVPFIGTTLCTLPSWKVK